MTITGGGGRAHNGRILFVWATRATVPSFVPSGRLDVLSCKVRRSAEIRIFTSESERMQTPL